MNREIKFRGKRVDNGEWVYWNVFGEYKDPFYTWHECRDHISEQDVIKETVGQFTGLTDENGIEIYEGDIFRDLKRNDYTVRFEDGAFRIYDGNEFALTQDDANYGFVVGNIHEVTE